jgi:hypothetical protein
MHNLGLNVHMTQVHKEQLNQVENAIAGRGGLDIEIFGMEGVPPEVIDQHNQQVTATHFADEAARQQATGNPTRGSGVNGTANKRAKKNETLEEIQERADKYRDDRANGVLPLPVAEVIPEPVSRVPLRSLRPLNVLLTFGKTPPAILPFAPPPGAIQYIPGQFPPVAVSPAQPGGIPGSGGLPQRPPFGAPPPGVFPPNGAPPGAEFTNSLDDLIADAQKPSTGESTADKKSKKDKNIKLVFFDDIVSPEEKMALLPRYAEFARV